MRRGKACVKHLNVCFWLVGVCVHDSVQTSNLGELFFKDIKLSILKKL